MAMTSITIPSEYGYVVLTATSTFFLAFWHGARSGVYRKKAGVDYPNAYADSASMSAASAEKKKSMYLFNCAQRAHGNFLENQPSVVAAMLISGLKYPLTATALGLGWSAARVVYALGYTREDKEGGKGRLAGAPMWLFQLALYGATGFFGYKLAF